MKPELLLSVDSERRFWLDPRTKLYMLVIFSIVMIDGKTDGISFWLKPVLALVPFFLLLSGRRKNRRLRNAKSRINTAFFCC